MAKMKIMLQGYRFFNLYKKDIYLDIPNDVGTRFDTSNYEINRPHLKKIIGLMKDELGGKIMTEFGALWAKPFSHSTDYKYKHKKAKDTKNSVI